MGRKTPPFWACPSWTEAKFNNMIRGALRTLHNQWPPMLEAKELARRDIPKEEREARGIRHRKEYQCASCKQWFKEKQSIKEGGKFNIQMDHTIPAGTSLTGWDDFITRLFRPVEDYQCLCLACHAKKTNEERKTNVYNRG